MTDSQAPFRGRKAIRTMSAQSEFEQFFAPELVAILERFIDERIALANQLPAVAEPRWLTINQAAQRLGCSPDAVRMRARRGRLETRRHGRRLYISARSVDSLGELS